MFSRLPQAVPDPIFSVAQAAAAAGAGAINASVGMMLDEEGKAFTLESVRRASEDMWRAASGRSFPYPPLAGLPEFRTAVTARIFGEATRVASVAAAGGTGAIAVLLRLARLLGFRDVLLPVPSWPNHAQLVAGTDMTLRDVPFLAGDMPDLALVTAAVSSLPRPTLLLLQAGCHNPTGMSWDTVAWQRLAGALAGSPHLVLLDCAYQGLGEGVEEDVQAARILSAADVPLLVAWSASKNHTIYGLRTGLACAVTGSDAERDNVERHLMLLLRQLHSAAPLPGQRVVATVQETYADLWEEDLAAIRASLTRKRAALIRAFPSWERRLSGKGLFAVLPIEKTVILGLRKRKIFLTDDGRVNIGGIPEARLDDFIAGVREAAG